MSCGMNKAEKAHSVAVFPFQNVDVLHLHQVQIRWSVTKVPKGNLKRNNTDAWAAVSRRDKRLKHGNTEVQSKSLFSCWALFATCSSFMVIPSWDSVHGGIQVQKPAMLKRVKEVRAPKLEIKETDSFSLHFPARCQRMDRQVWRSHKWRSQKHPVAKRSDASGIEERFSQFASLHVGLKVPKDDLKQTQMEARAQSWCYYMIKADVGSQHPVSVALIGFLQGTFETRWKKGYQVLLYIGGILICFGSEKALRRPLQRARAWKSRRSWGQRWSFGKGMQGTNEKNMGILRLVVQFSSIFPYLGIPIDFSTTLDQDVPKIRWDEKDWGLVVSCGQWFAALSSNWVCCCIPLYTPINCHCNILVNILSNYYRHIWYYM